MYNLLHKEQLHVSALFIEKGLLSMFVALYCYTTELRLKHVVAGSSKRKLGLGPKADAVGFVVDRNWFVFPYIRHPLGVIITMMVDNDVPRSLVFQNQSTN